MAFLPLLKVGTIKQAAALYSDDVIFLFTGGFLLDWIGIGVVTPEV